MLNNGRRSTLPRTCLAAKVWAHNSPPTLPPFQAERTALSKDEYAMTLLDIVEGFERIPHAHLFEHGWQFGYNLTLLRLPRSCLPLGKENQR